MLGRVPAICGSLRQISTPCSYQRRALCIEGFSTWHVTNSSNCRLPNEKTVPGLLQIGFQEPTPCTFGGDGFSQWPGPLGEQQNAPNYLGVLALGWSYILSARLGEILGNGATMAYTSSCAMVYSGDVENEDSSNTVLDIGEVTEDVCRWWTAILAPYEGWKAVISRRDGQEYLAPWSISMESTLPIGIRRRIYSTLLVRPARPPPSSAEAFGHLAEFALYHNLGSQFLVALTMAMTIPTHRFHGSVIQLPLPIGSKVQQENASATSVPSEWIALGDELPFYMTLSCSPEVVISSLCGMFWEPSIDCNMVSPWLHPILNEVPLGKGIAGTPGFYYEVLAVICSFRQPRISSLWLGAVASGLTPIVLRRIKRGRPPLDINAFPWTGCPQSFMDVAGSGPYIIEGSEDSVRREDVWRLLHLPPVIDDDLYYNNRPFTPWAPPGSTTAPNCPLRVRSHLNCVRHSFEYQKWNWKAEDGSVIEDEGFSKDTTCKGTTLSNGLEIKAITLEIPEQPFDQEASEEASLDVFRWVMVNGEGVPPEEIYRHDWLRIDEDDDELSASGDGYSSSHAPDEKEEREIEDWLNVSGLPDSNKNLSLQ
jgi:hypothetical protein